MAKKRRSSGQGTLFKRKPDGPWIAAWYDHAGKRRARSTRTTDRRAGVAPQLAQKIMRHADYKTTLKHYTVLGVADTANAINQLPHIQQKQHEAATGTCDETPRKACILKQQQLAHETKQISAIRCDGDERERIQTLMIVNTLEMRHLAIICKVMRTETLKRASGFEPPTSSLGSWHSTTELRPQSIENERLIRFLNY
jgi:hypothetical protein